MQANTGRLAQRHFGVIESVADDGSALIKRLDGGGIVPLNAAHARHLGELRVGQRIEVSIRYTHSAGGTCAVEPELLEGRVLAAMAAR
jgi:hypothetical protein